VSRRPRVLATFLVTGVALFMTSLDNLVVTNALPAIRVHLGAGLEGLEWTVNAYTLSFAVFLLSGAAYGDRFGRRRTFLVGLSVFTAASAAAALAPNVGTLIAARAVQGVGGAIVVPLTLTILAGAVTDEWRPMALAGWSALSGLAIALGPVIGGAIVQGANWQWIFWVNVPIGLALLPLGRALLAESVGPNDRLDTPGTVLATAGLFGVVLGLVRANGSGWTSPLVVGSLAGGAALLVAFVGWERRAAAPMLPLRLFGVRGFAASNGAAMLLTTGMFGVVFLLAQFLQTVQGYSPLEAGIRTLPWTAAPVLAAPVAALLAPKVGMRPLVSLGTALQVGSLVWLALAVSPNVAYPRIVPPLVLAGIGMGLFFALIAPLMLSFVRSADEGIASGVSNGMRELGVVLGVAILAAVFAGTGGYASGAAFVAGLRPALWVGAGLVAVALVTSLLVPARAARPAAHQTRPAAEPTRPAADLEPAS